MGLVASVPLTACVNAASRSLGLTPASLTLRGMAEKCFESNVGRVGKGGETRATGSLSCPAFFFWIIAFPERGVHEIVYLPFS